MVEVTAAPCALASALHVSPALVGMKMAKKMVHPKNIETSADQHAHGYASVPVRGAVRQHNQRFVPVDGHLDVLEARRQDVAASLGIQDPLKDSCVTSHTLTERPFMGVVQLPEVMQSDVKVPYCNREGINPTVFVVDALPVAPLGVELIASSTSKDDNVRPLARRPVVVYRRCAAEAAIDQSLVVGYWGQQHHCDG